MEIREGEVHEAPAHTYANLGEVLPADLDTMHLSIGALAKEIQVVEADGYDATPLRVDYHVKLADILACVLLPASVLFFAIGGPPFPGPAQTLLVSGIVGVAYILLMAVSSSLGRGGVVPPPSTNGWCSSMPTAPPQVRMPIIGASCRDLIASANHSPAEPVSSFTSTTQWP